MLLLNRLFTLMAISGLLLAGWGLMVTPDDIRANRDRESPLSFMPSSDPEANTYAGNDSVLRDDFNKSTLWSQ